MNAAPYSRSRAEQGFSLVELMIAMVAGLLVSLAAVAFFYSSVRSNGDYVSATRLTQELRNNLDFITANCGGPDTTATPCITCRCRPPARSVHPSARSPWSILAPRTAASCSPTIAPMVPRHGGAGAGRAPRRPSRRAQRHHRWHRHRCRRHRDRRSDATATTLACDGAAPDYTVYPPACNSASGWCAMSDPRKLNITA
jgi:prepilin-type N-terminal cleavage/methylation domain-containing protein